MHVVQLTLTISFLEIPLQLLRQMQKLGRAAEARHIMRLRVVIPGASQRDMLGWNWQAVQADQMYGSRHSPRWS